MVKLIIAIVILILLFLFTIQNTDQVEVNFWPWKFVLSKALLSLAALLCGLVVGVVTVTVRRILKRKRT